MAQRVSGSVARPRASPSCKKFNSDRDPVSHTGKISYGNPKCPRNLSAGCCLKFQRASDLKEGPDLHDPKLS